MRILLLLFISFFMTSFAIASMSDYVSHHHEAEVFSSYDLILNEDEDAEEEEPECD